MSGGENRGERTGGKKKKRRGKMTKVGGEIERNRIKGKGKRGKDERSRRMKRKKGK